MPQFDTVHLLIPQTLIPFFNQAQLRVNKGTTNHFELFIAFSLVSLEESTSDNIGRFSAQIQEYAIIEDLLFVLLVIERENCLTRKERADMLIY